MATLLRSLYPALLLLRLAHRKNPGMDKLYYYCRRMDQTLSKSSSLLDKISSNYTNDVTGLFDKETMVS